MKNLIMVSMIVLSVISGLYLPAKADIDNSANGQWQYVIKRGDAKAVGGSLPPPIDCPLYVGYFSLDFRPIKADSKGRYVMRTDKGDHQIFGSSQRFVVGVKSYEMKGSYTPIDANEYCTKPLTKATGEKAPLLMRKVEANGRKLEWDSDFLYGSKSQNAIWQVKADYDGSNTMRGTLKAYVCAGNKRNSCKLLNTAKFFAKRIDSIQNASKKPLFSRSIELSLLDRLFSSFSNISQPKNTGGESLYSADEEVLLTKYMKPSLLAVLPALADGNDARTFCIAQGGRSSGSDLYGGARCALCKQINCKPGQTPSGEPEEGDCYGSNCSGCGVCKCDSCRDCGAGKCH
jgi:hypothetical protein